MREEIKNKLNEVAVKYKWLNSLRLIVASLVFLYGIISYFVSEVINWTPTNEISRALAKTMHLPHHPYIFWPFMIVSGTILVLSIFRKSSKENTKKSEKEESLANEISFLLAEIDNFQLGRKLHVIQQAGDIYREYDKETLIRFSKKFAKRIIKLRSELRKAGTSSKELDKHSNFNDIETIKKCLSDLEKQLA